MSQPQTTVEIAEPEQEWVFTFGAGQRGYSASHTLKLAPDEPDGFPLDYRYVVIRGTHSSARAEMMRIFGRVWSFQYDSREDAGVDEHELVELVIATPRDEVTS